ncbi:MAG: hypothetical protein JNN32_07065 [Flavobacteriales bacterium]|nr:hypothetical protein [Flavobacteriales bacterium]
MELTTTTPRPLHWSLLFVTAVFVTLLLYFIDEGRYSLEGLLTVGNGIAMGIYLLGLLLGLALMAQLFAKRHPSPVRTVLVLSLGTVVGFVFGLLLMMGVGALQLLG